MPHCVIEISRGMMNELDLDALMQSCAVALHDVGCFEANDIKVRVREIAHSFIGIESQFHSMMAAEVQVLDNKTPEQLKQISQNLQKALETAAPQLPGLQSITTRITLMNPDWYSKTLRSL